MLNKNYEILCKLNLAQNNITVNNVIRAVNYELKNAAIEIIGRTIDDIQHGLLNHFLGTRWNEFENKIVPWICPHCNERSSFVRRGSRLRKLKISEGIIKFNLFQVTCKSCSKTFSPFLQLLGLKPRTRISTEFEEKIVKLALENSYDKTSKYIEEFTGRTISHTASRNITLRVSDSISINHEINEFDSILIDGTKVKSGSKERGAEIHIALAPVKRINKNGRMYNEKRILAFSIGTSYKKFKKQLSKYSCENVIVDGDSSYSNLIKEVFSEATHSRCIWHIPRQLFNLLYMNNVPVKEREAFLYALIGILKTKNFYRAINEYFDFIQMFDKLQFHDIVSFLKNAMAGIFHNKEDWNSRKKHSSNSLLECEMREINRHATHNFDQYFKQNRRPIINSSQVSLCS